MGQIDEEVGLLDDLMKINICYLFHFFIHRVSIVPCLLIILHYWQLSCRLRKSEFVY